MSTRPEFEWRCKYILAWGIVINLKYLLIKLVPTNQPRIANDILVEDCWAKAADQQHGSFVELLQSSNGHYCFDELSRGENCSSVRGLGRMLLKEPIKKNCLVAALKERSFKIVVLAFVILFLALAATISGTVFSGIGNLVRSD